MSQAAEPRPAVLCKNCPFRKAGEIGGSIPAHDSADSMRAAVRDCIDGFHVMQCHNTSDAKPRACAGFLSVVVYRAIGVRIAAAIGAIRQEDVGKPFDGLYESLREMLKEADYLDLPEVRV